MALANLEIFQREQTLVQVRKKSRLLASLLQPVAELPHVGDIRQCGFMVGIELVENRDTKTPYPLERRIGHRVAQACRVRGLLLRPLGNVIALVPPLSMRPRELTKMVAILHTAIRETTENSSAAP